jgi:adenylate cyclase
MLTKKYLRYFFHALPFGITWLVFALIYALLEYGLIGVLDHYPSTGNPYSFKITIQYPVVGSFLTGLLQGLVEVIWLRRLFESKPLWVKIVVKSAFYLSLIILFLVGISMVVSAILKGTSVFDAIVLTEVKDFVTAFAFWSIVIYMAITINLALAFSEIKEYFGGDTFYSFLLGKYHTPNQETRIFMFLDMRSSTAIAERLGHERYFELIKKYYSNMTQPIQQTSGDIYQYVGDEIVVSWIEKKGLNNNNCIECFRKISESIDEHKEEYMERFCLVPEFKAGYHIGEVTTGEIGIIKKDIIYTGDALNTTARIQGECNKYKEQVLISENLLNKLAPGNDFRVSEIATIQLRGKTTPTKLYGITF